MTRSRVISLPPPPSQDSRLDTGTWTRTEVRRSGCQTKTITRTRVGCRLTTIIEIEAFEEGKDDDPLFVRKLTKYEETNVSALVEYSDVRDAVEVVTDDSYSSAPWENCDGWDHKLTDLPSAYDRTERRSYRVAFIDRAHQLIVMDDDGFDEMFTYCRMRGYARQVAYELSKLSVSRRYKQLRDWYEEGWTYYGVKGEFLGGEASVWGIDDYDHASTEVVEEITDELIHAIEKLGYLVVNQPGEDKAKKLEERRRRLHYNLNQQNWDGPLCRQSPAYNRRMRKAALRSARRKKEK